MLYVRTKLDSSFIRFISRSLACTLTRSLARSTRCPAVLNVLHAIEIRKFVAKCATMYGQSYGVKVTSSIIHAHEI